MAYLAFYGLAAVAVTTAVLVVAMRPAAYSALALIVCFGAMAGLFFQLGAEFIAAIQVIVYAGAIMVLFLFVIMLTDPESEVFPPDRLRKIPLFALASALVFTFLLLQAAGQWSVAQGFPGILMAQTEGSSGPGGETVTLARSLFREYLLPFEVTSILILVAVIGAIVLTRQHD